jgi:hypothetical protein
MNTTKDININYVVALYFGARKMPGVNNMLRKDPYSVAKAHLHALNTLDIPAVKKATFVVSEYKHDVDKGILKVIDEYQSKIPIEVVFRKNLGYSYSAWNDVVNSEIDICDSNDYFFLFEDDYVANEDYFYQDYLDKLKDNVGYVCQDKGEFHARLGNGIISADIAKKIKESQGSVFFIPHQNDDYDGAILNQYHFLDSVKKAGYSLAGMEDKHVTIYQHAYGFNYRGNLAGNVAIAPVSENDWKLPARDARHSIFRKYSECLSLQYLDLRLEKIRNLFVDSKEIDKENVWCLFHKDPNDLIGYFQVIKDKDNIVIEKYITNMFTGYNYTQEQGGFIAWAKETHPNHKVKTVTKCLK